MSEIRNPFPGPQPYRAEHRDFFCGREDLARRLCQSVLAHGVLTVYGPSGAGKSSLVQARVLQLLEEEYDVRAVTVDGWPAGISPPARLLDEMVRQLALPRAPEGESAVERIGKAVRLAEQRSEQAIVIHLDQIEQLLFPGRPPEDLDDLVAAVAALADRPARGLRVVLGLREDYLGLLRARSRGRRQMLDRSVRVGPLTVAEMAAAVCEAAGRGTPPQAWDQDRITAILLDVRAPGQEAAGGEAEVQAVYAQIVCRALWAERAAPSPAAAPAAQQAQGILERYLEAALAELGPRKDAAQQLLEEHLVTREGRRNLRTLSELERELPGVEVGTILQSLETAGVLRGHEHQGGDRYFEVGHDWLARRVFERKQERKRDEEQRLALLQQQMASEREIQLAKKEGEERLAEEAARRRRLARISLGGGAVLVAMAILAVVAWSEARRATQLSLLASARELTARGRPAWAAKLLLDVDGQTADWSGAALDALARSSPRVTLLGHTQTVRALDWSPDGTRLASASEDMTARISRADGSGEAIVLRGHSRPVLGVAWSPDGSRLATWSSDGTARVWPADGGAPLVLDHGPGNGVTDAAWSPDGRRLAVALRDHTARVWDLEAPERTVDLSEHLREVLAVSWSPDGRRVATSSNDTSAMIWDLDRPEHPVVLGEPIVLVGGAKLRPDHEGHSAAVVHVRWSPDGARVVTASSDRTARVWNADGTGDPVVLAGHTGWVVDAQWSPDGARIVTCSHDKTARVWSPGGTGEIVSLIGHTDAVYAARFRPDGLRIVTASMDTTARVWLASGAGQPVVLWGHEARLHDARFSPDGARVATASEDDTVKIWTGQAWNAVAAAPASPVPKIHSSDLAPDGRRVLTALSGKRAAMVWSLDGGPTVTIPLQATFDPNLVAWSPDGYRVALGSDNGWVRIAGADGGAGVTLPFLDGSRRRLAYNLAWSPDSKRVLVATDLGVEIWDPAPTPPARIALVEEKGHAGFASWSPDGRRIALISNSGKVRLAQADGSGQPVTLGEHDGQGFVALFSPDGTRVLSAGADKVARVWSLAGGRTLELRHPSTVLLAAFSPDGRRVVTGGNDRVARVWELDRASSPAYEPLSLTHEDVLSTVAFTDGGARVLSVSQGVARRWPYAYTAFTAALRAVNDDCLPAPLRRKYLDETEPSAASRYAACEKAAGRAPSPAR